MNDKDQLWKLKRYYEKVISDYYSTDEIDPDVANRIADGLTRFMNIAEQQQQEIEDLQDELARWEAGLNQTKEMYELQRQLRQAQEKIEQQQQEFERLQGLADEMNNELFSERMTIDGLKWQLQQAEKRIEQLEIKLNSIRFYVENPVPEDELAETILHIINDPEHDGI